MAAVSKEYSEARARYGLDALSPTPARSTNGHGAQVAYLPTFSADLTTSGGFSRWLKENSARAVPVWVLEQLFDIIREQVLRINELKNAVAALDARATGVDAVLARRGGVNGVRWGGVHEVGATYREGELVSRGGLWLAKTTTTSTPGTDPGAWVLIVRAKTKDVE